MQLGGMCMPCLRLGLNDGLLAAILATRLKDEGVDLKIGLDQFDHSAEIDDCLWLLNGNVIVAARKQCIYGHITIRNV